MKTEMILDAIKDRKGAFLNVRLTSEIEPLKAHKGREVKKITEMTIVSGISFENRKDVKDAIEAGERSEVGQLPWGTWKQFPFVIEHKGADYVRLYLPSEAQREAGFARQTITKFYIDGKEISRDEAKTFVGSKAEKRENEFGCMTVKAENLSFI
jgi:hypothetical protein